LQSELQSFFFRLFQLFSEQLQILIKFIMDISAAFIPLDIFNTFYFFSQSVFVQCFQPFNRFLFLGLKIFSPKLKSSVFYFWRKYFFPEIKKLRFLFLGLNRLCIFLKSRIRQQNPDI